LSHLEIFATDESCVVRSGHAACSPTPLATFKSNHIITCLEILLACGGIHSQCGPSVYRSGVYLLNYQCDAACHVSMWFKAQPARPSCSHRSIRSRSCWQSITWLRRTVAPCRELYDEHSDRRSARRSTLTFTRETRCWSIDMRPRRKKTPTAVVLIFNSESGGSVDQFAS
jgi:hypothetical protein